MGDSLLLMTRVLFALLLAKDVRAFSLGGNSKQTPRQAVDDMLRAVTVPEEIVACVEGRSQRTLIRGACAVNDDPRVLRSVEILYEDLRIFRPAGRLLLRQLHGSAANAQRLYDDLAAAGYKAALDALPALRRIFDAMDKDGDGQLDESELERAATLHRTAAVAQLCLDADGQDADECALSLSFPEFVGVVAADAQTCRDAAVALEPGEATSNACSRRFDRMADEFLSWEGAAAEGGYSGRQAEVVQGCFAGARNAALLDALRLIYVEYPVLRGAGDVIFRMLRPRAAPGEPP